MTKLGVIHQRRKRIVPATLCSLSSWLAAALRGRSILFAIMMICGVIIAAAGVANHSSNLPERWAGLWILHADLGAPGITALTDGQAKNMLGQKIRISQNHVQLGSEECAFPTFQISTETTAEFLSDYRVSPEQFPLLGTKVQILDINCRQSVTYRLGRLENGCTLFGRDGHFFQIIRHAEIGGTTAPRVPQCRESLEKH